MVSILRLLQTVRLKSLIRPRGTLKSSRANKIVKIHKKLGRVIAVAAIMTVFSKKHKNSTKLVSRKTVLDLNSKELVLDKTN